MINYLLWDIDPEFVNLFGISVRYYGILYVGGLIKTEAFAKINIDKKKFYTENAYTFLFGND